MTTAWQRIRKMLAIPETLDPTEQRMKQITNMLLITFTVIATLSFLFIFAYSSGLADVLSNPDARQLLEVSSFTILASIGLSALLRWKRTPKNLVGWLLTGFLLVAVFLSDTSQNLTIGPSLASWVVPILTSAIVLPPASVFLTDTVIFAMIFYLTTEPRWENYSPWYSMSLFVISILAWLGMSIANRSTKTAHNEAQKNLAILQGVAEGVIVVDQEGQITLSNHVAKELTGDELTSLVKTAETNAEVDGKILSLRWSNVPNVGRVAIVRNITREVEAERAKEAVLGVVSHELRTPLAVIDGAAQLLGITPPQQIDGLRKRIRSNVKRMNTLIGDMLDQAQAEAGAFILRHEPYSLSTLIEDVQDLFSEEAMNKGFPLSVIVDENMPTTLMGDKDRLLQICSNLVGNAIKFTSQGEVKVSISRLEENKWQIMVSDTGIGIAPDRLPDIFKPFRCASDYATRRHRGVGLGLSIVKFFVEKMNGEISVSSKVDQGTNFVITLPLEIAG